MSPLCLSCFAAALLFALPADDPAPTGDLAKLQGKWTVQAGREQGVPATLEVKGRQATITSKLPQGERQIMKAEIKLNEKANPRAIDFLKGQGPEGEAAPDTLAIYKLDGDHLKICFGELNTMRPAAFPKSESDGNCVTWTRESQKP